MTQVLARRRGSLGAPTDLAAPRPATAPPRAARLPAAVVYYDTRSRRRRSLWPLVLGVARDRRSPPVGGFLSTSKVETTIDTQQAGRGPVRPSNPHEQNAEAMIKAQGLQVQRQERASETVAPGSVISQTPSAGDRAAEGRRP